MAKGKTITIQKTIDNKASNMVTHVVEPIVINGQLQPDNNDVNPGVNSRDMHP